MSHPGCVPAVAYVLLNRRQEAHLLRHRGTLGVLPRKGAPSRQVKVETGRGGTALWGWDSTGLPSAKSQMLLLSCVCILQVNVTSPGKDKLQAN